jgi:hypothetical protein
VPYEGDATGNTVYTHVNLKVYKSTNYAGTWTALGTTGLPTTGFVIRNVGVAPSNNNYVGIAGSGGKVFFTTNGGTSWTQAATPANSNLSMNSIAFDRANPSIVYLSSVAPTATHNHLWRSTNLGATWTAIDSGGFPFGVPVNAVTTDPGVNTTLFAATHLGVYRSTTLAQPGPGTVRPAARERDRHLHLAGFGAGPSLHVRPWLLGAAAVTIGRE